jgi:hypothetical protein
MKDHNGKILNDFCQIFVIKLETYEDHDYDDYKIFYLI